MDKMCRNPSGETEEPAKELGLILLETMPGSAEGDNATRVEELACQD